MFPSLTSADPLSLLTLVAVCVLAVIVLLGNGNGTAGFKRAAGDAYKNRVKKQERMAVLEAVIEENLADPQYEPQTVELLKSKVRGKPHGTSSVDSVS